MGGDGMGRGGGGSILGPSHLHHLICGAQVPAVGRLPCAAPQQHGCVPPPAVPISFNGRPRGGGGLSPVPPLGASAVLAA